MKEIVKTEISNKTGNTRITYSDGTVEIIKANAPRPEEDNVVIPLTTAEQAIKEAKLTKTGIAALGDNYVKPDEMAVAQLNGKNTGQTDFDKSLARGEAEYLASKTTDSTGKMNWADAAGMGLSGLQAGYGLQQLMKDKRPIDKLDPAYNKLTNEAIANSQFGYTPEQKSMLQQQIVEGKNAQVASINSMAGGNAAVGLNNARAAINNMYANNLKLASEDERLRMQKAQYAGAMAGNRANMSRQLFADNMNAFQQKQQAGAQLLNTGLRNLVGSIRVPQERAHQDEMNKLIYGG